MISRTRKACSCLCVSVTMLEYSSSSSRSDFSESPSTCDLYLAVNLRLPRSPFPRGATCLAALRQYWARDGPTWSCSFVNWRASSRRTYRLSPGFDSISSRLAMPVSPSEEVKRRAIVPVAVYRQIALSR